MCCDTSSNSNDCTVITTLPKKTNRPPRTIGVGRVLSFWDSFLAGAILVLGRCHTYTYDSIFALILALFPNQLWLGESSWTMTSQDQPCHLCSERGMVSGLMLCHLTWLAVSMVHPGNPISGTRWLAAEKGSGIDKSKGFSFFLEKKNLVPRYLKAFLFPHGVFSKNFFLIVLQTPNRVVLFLNFTHHQFPSKETSTLRSDSAVFLEVC